MANDIIAYARDFYLANLPETDYVVRDIRQIQSFPSADLLVGCYPCQGFSEGGVRDPKRPINLLYREFARALKIVQPKAFIVENVPGLAHAHNAHLLRNQIVSFQFAGYRVKWKILNAADYGVAQERRRLFFVGIRSKIDFDFEFPAPTHGANIEGLTPKVSQKDAISDLPEWPEGEFCDQPLHWYYLSRNRRRDWDKPAQTIVSQERHVPLHPMSPPLVKLGPDKWTFRHAGPFRRFSYREASRLQGYESAIFPDRDTTSIKYKVIGNAVPPALFHAVAESVEEIC